MSVYRAAQVRLSQPVRPELAQVCLPGPDESVLGKYARLREQLGAFHAFDKAHILMLAEQRLLARDDAVAMLEVLRKVERDGVVEVRAETAENMHSGEAILTRELGSEVAGKLHLGRSSGDLLAVSFRLTLRGKLIALYQAGNKLRATLLDLAQAHIETVMPGYTHLQHAQPITFAHYLLSMLSGLDRDGERIRQFYSRLNLSPAGAAILVGSEFALDRERTADLLGFDGLALNTRDAVWGRDLEIEAHAIATLMAGNINRLAEDLMLWSAPEYGMLECADGFCGTSSIMPQKKNPNALECLKGLVATTSGMLVSAVVVHKNPSTVPVFEWIRALSDHWRSYDELIDGTMLMDALLGSLQVHTSRMAQSANAHWATAADLAGAMVRHAGVHWRAAHQIAGITVRLALEAGRTPSQVDSGLIDQAARLFMNKPLSLDDEVIRDALDAHASVLRHELPGGPAPRRVREAIVVHQKLLDADKQWLLRSGQRLDAAAERLEAAIDALLGERRH
ncbi:argininosuccinate lyase [Pollutimonas sp. H1-120]|uniref:argininosuccinate lyase n=1 Tax=Pollutimonas sp. H1-120 TaxID=3148824 RepID=UPI003B52E9C0